MLHRAHAGSGEHEIYIVSIDLWVLADGTRVRLTYHRPGARAARIQEAWGAWVRAGAASERDVLVLNSGAHWSTGLVAARSTRLASSTEGAMTAT